MQSSLVSRNVTLSNGRTSLRLEPEFWNVLTTICARERITLGKWIEAVAADAEGGRTSAVRVGVLRYLRGSDGPNRAPDPAADGRQWIAELGGRTAAGNPDSSEESIATIG